MEEAKKLIANLAALLFPAFKEPTRRKRPGRPLASGPKYEVEFLKQTANIFDEMKSRNKNAIPAERFYNKFLAENKEIAEKLCAADASLTWGSFKKLLSAGRAARDKKIIWRANKNYLPCIRRITGRYFEVDPFMGDLHEGLQLVFQGTDTVFPDLILMLDPTDKVDRLTINAFYNIVRAGLCHKFIKHPSSHDENPSKSAAFAAKMLARLESAWNLNP